ncbi:DUF3916 domain-containing protein [Aeromonas schubertii]|uniref:DUF3916 domain-containing protein n=1 Tax=Aeromonas schubertii TaxID=652 RepID=UPI0009E24185|nr:DUF3916 domain-containing protein [Aeromonas schubertii]
MRRISVNRPKEKVRGIKRRLRALDNWADSFEGCFPSEYADEKYCNWKIPVLDRLVGPPTTTNEIQAHCAQAILRAVKHLFEARPDEYNYAIVSALITYPQMFGSEVCIFFDKEYYDSFYDRNSEWQSLTPIENRKLSSVLNFDVPNPIIQKGYVHRTKDEWEGEITTYEEEWWSFSAR